MKEVPREVPQKRVDRRVAKTRKAIHAAFRKLVLAEDISKITVSALAREADIDRKTFYLHFSSINDLIHWETSFLVDRVAEALLINTQDNMQNNMQDPQNSQNGSKQDTVVTTNMKRVLVELAKIIDKDEEFNSRMFLLLPINEMAEALFEPIYSAALRNDIYKDAEDPQALAYVVRFYIAGTLSLFVSWIKEGRVQPIDSIANIFARAIEEHKSHKAHADNA